MTEIVTSKDERFKGFCDKKLIIYPSIVKHFEIEGDEIKSVVFWGKAPENCDEGK